MRMGRILFIELKQLIRGSLGLCVPSRPEVSRAKSGFDKLSPKEPVWVRIKNVPRTLPYPQLKGRLAGHQARL